MTEEDFNSQLLAFFKALADENRLKIVGLLAQREFSVEELAETLSLGVSTTSHHSPPCQSRAGERAHGWALLPLQPAYRGAERNVAKIDSRRGLTQVIR